MGAPMEKPGQAMSEIVCAACGATGHATWEGSPRQLAVLSETFSNPEGTRTGVIAITCNSCGAQSQLSA